MPSVKTISAITKDCCLILISQLCAIGEALECRLSSPYPRFNRSTYRIYARPVIGHNKYLQCLARFKRGQNLTKFNYF